MKTYFVIGSSSGIGKEVTRKLLANGHKVIGTYYKDTVVSDQQNLEYHYLNVQEEEVKTDFLPESIDGLIYCPGSIKLKPFKRIKPQQFVEDFQLQVVGAIKVIQNALPNLKADPGGSIVMFSTVAVQSGFNFHTQVSASKGAVEGLIRSLAAELAPGIRVNGIAPSMTDTPLASSLLSNQQKKEANAEKHPLKRIGTPEDIANMAEFLLTEKSSWITGQIMHVDGGMSSLKV